MIIVSPVTNILEDFSFPLSLHLEHFHHLQAVVIVCACMCMQHILLHHTKHSILMVYWVQSAIEAVVMAVQWVFFLVTLVKHLQSYLDVTQRLNMRP